METYYHGSSALFKRFDLSHVLEGDGKVKFGYGVYLTSSFKSAAHYSGSNQESTSHYVYTVEIPNITDDNHISFKRPVNPAIVKRAEKKLDCPIPAKMVLDGKDFRKYLAKTLGDVMILNQRNWRQSFLMELGWSISLGPIHGKIQIWVLMWQSLMRIKSRLSR